MSFKTVKNAVLIGSCLVLALGNVYAYTIAPEGTADNIVFYDRQPDSGLTFTSDSDKEFYDSPLDSKKDSSDLVNINTAGLEELKSLPGIGEVKAKAILAYREKYGGFVAEEEITEVKGIGSATYEKLKKLITVK